MIDMKEDDVFYWSNEKVNYWCCSRIALFYGGRLLDTYWLHFYRNDPNDVGPDAGKPYRVSYSYQSTEVVRDDSELKFLGNLDDYDWKGERSTSEPYDKQYDQSDILDLNHANSTSGGIFIKKGAVKSIEVQRRTLLDEINRAKRSIDSMNWTIKRAKQDLVELEAGQ